IPPVIPADGGIQRDESNSGKPPIADPEKPPARCRCHPESCMMMGWHGLPASDLPWPLIPPVIPAKAGIHDH
ncbi:MAG TPA: hypothetical protein PK395_12885, partial [bacterium]|nr:hypothetical protein [bacterium]